MSSREGEVSANMTAYVSAVSSSGPGRNYVNSLDVSAVSVN